MMATSAPLADSGARLGCGIDEDLVEHDPPDGVRLGDVAVGRRGAPEHEGPRVEKLAANRRAAGANDRGQEPPALERRHARLVQEVARECVAREARAVHQQHRYPRRARSIAVGEPAQRAPATIAS